MKILFSLILLLLNLSLLRWNPASIYPYVPPLTHTPKMGLSLIAHPTPAPSDLLPNCKECQKLRAVIAKREQKGHKLRWRMQEETLALLDLLPPSFAQESLQNRSLNEHSIGEVRLWATLVQSMQ